MIRAEDRRPTMKRGIWEIGEARLCVSCQIAMEAEYVIEAWGNERGDNE